jgi:hypothetical protein
VTVLDADLRERYQRAVAQRLTKDRSACPSVEALEALAGRTGAESARLATLDHVMKCAACQADFELFRAIHGAGKSTRPALAPRWYAIAAAAVLVVGMSFFALRDSPPLMRGDSAAAGGPVPIAPRGDVEVATTRRFVWRSVPNAIRYAVELLETGGRVRATAAVTDTVWQLPDSVQLRSGLELDWWVRAELPGGREERSPFVRLRVR